MTARPHTACPKVVDAVGDVAPTAVEAVVPHARHRELAQVKWEGRTVSHEAATAVGFVPLSAPRTPVEVAGGPAPAMCAGCTTAR